MCYSVFLWCWWTLSHLLVFLDYQCHIPMHVHGAVFPTATCPICDFHLIETIAYSKKIVMIIVLVAWSRWIWVAMIAGQLLTSLCISVLTTSYYPVFYYKISRKEQTLTSLLFLVVIVCYYNYYTLYTHYKQYK